MRKSEAEQRAEVWAGWTETAVSVRDRLHDMLIGDLSAWFRTGSLEVLDPMVQAMQATRGFVNTNHVFKWVAKFGGLTITPKGNGVDYSRDGLSEVWQDRSKALSAAKAKPYYAWQVPPTVSAWVNPFESMIKGYAFGLLVGKISQEEVKKEVGENLLLQVVSKAKDSKFVVNSEKRAKGMGLTLNVLN